MCVFFYSFFFLWEIEIASKWSGFASVYTLVPAGEKGTRTIDSCVSSSDTLAWFYVNCLE